MNAKRLYYILLGGMGACVVILLVGTLLANASLQKSAQGLIDAKTQSAVTDQEQSQLVHQRADIAKYKDLADIAKSIVPQDKDQAQTVRELVGIANTYGISLGSITFPTSSLGGKGGEAKAKLSQLTPVTGIPGVYSLDLTVQSDTTKPVPYSKFLDFLSALEQNRRTALVNGISLQPDLNDASELTFTLNLSEYIKP